MSILSKLGHLYCSTAEWFPCLKEKPVGSSDELRSRDLSTHSQTPSRGGTLGFVGRTVMNLVTPLPAVHSRHANAPKLSNHSYRTASRPARLPDWVAAKLCALNRLSINDCFQIDRPSKPQLCSNCPLLSRPATR